MFLSPRAHCRSPMTWLVPFSIRMFVPMAFRRRTGFAAPEVSSLESKVCVVTKKKPSESSAMLLYSVGTKDACCARCSFVESSRQTSSYHVYFTSLAPMKPVNVPSASYFMRPRLTFCARQKTRPVVSQTSFVGRNAIDWSKVASVGRVKTLSRFKFRSAFRMRLLFVSAMNSVPSAMTNTSCGAESVFGVMSPEISEITRVSVKFSPSRATCRMRLLPVSTM